MESVAELHKHIDELSFAIDVQLEALKSLEKRRSDARRVLNSRLDPVARLPLEISTEIFKLCTPTFPRPVLAKEPLKFLHVCRLWREIAVSCPSLWTGIQINGNESTDPEFYEACSNWLGRARPLPLSISLHGSVDVPLGVLLKRFACHIAHLELYIPDDSSLYGVQWEVPFPSLQTMEIIFFSSKEAGEDSEMSDDSEFDVDIFYDSCIDLLLGAPSLVECIFNSIQYATDLERDRAMHTSLRHLRLGTPSVYLISYRSWNSANILLYLKLPALETLHLTDLDISPGDFVSFFSESGCAASLQALYMDISNNDEWHFSSDLLSLCFRPFAALKTLEFFHGIEHDFMLFIEVLGSAQDFLPNLNHFFLHGYFGKPSHWKALLDMMLSRGSARNGSLQSVKVMSRNIPNGMDPDAGVLLRICELVKEGMSIYVGTLYTNLI
ncbi:hypothetical protein R3P38DRAFT_2872756 [Favolaschia claudopus]|uniref:F-box domain-containing protein n=1 Tax=Favolaschia claudopus TaxID=2862362 RepID=A0AAW0DEA4_9AGAR